MNDLLMKLAIWGALLCLVRSIDLASSQAIGDASQANARLAHTR